jgi:uncharacterized membrane protein
MSKACCKTYGTGFTGSFGQGSNCVCSLPTLIILILIILQFSKKDKDYGSRKRFGDKLVDDGILFIIALFYLSCTGCGRTSTY